MYYAKIFPDDDYILSNDRERDECIPLQEMSDEKGVLSNDQEGVESTLS